jgi:hypothetical protein
MTKTLTAVLTMEVKVPFDVGETEDETYSNFLNISDLVENFIKKSLNRSIYKGKVEVVGHSFSGLP